MILIDKPYVSDFLIETIKKNRFKIVATKDAKELIKDDTLNWIDEPAAIQYLIENSNAPIYSNSENAIGWVNYNLPFSKLPDTIELFKNKIKFRDLIKSIYPNYFYLGVDFKDINNISSAKIPFPCILKPAVGFFSLGVHKIEKKENWNATILEIQNEIKEIKQYYPNQVLNVDKFIIEEYITGEEYAIDCFFNEYGKPVILNILHHVFSSGKDVSDRIYTTSKKIILENLKPIEKFLLEIGAKTKLKNFPIHVEVRKDNNGAIIPIEINPLRFGGWCTTADLTWHAYGFNSYEYFINGLEPNWESILKSKKTELYSLIILNNNSSIEAKNIASFNYDLLLNDFEKPLKLRKFDFNKYPIFGMLFTKTSIENIKELSSILTSDLKKYIKIKPTK